MSVVFYTTLVGCRPIPAPQRELPDFALVAIVADGTQRPLAKRDLLGRVWIADFVFTRCAGPCPLLTANLSALRKRLPQDAGLLSFTVDPDHDSPAALAAYARKFGADGRWLFVTGPKAELTRLIKDGFLLPVAENAAAAPGERVAHSSKFALLDAQGRVRDWYDGDDPAALDRLVADAKRL